MTKTLNAGDVIRGRFRLDTVLGRGGFAETWRGLDLVTNEAVAVKALSMRAVEQWRAIELFEREARVLRNLNHPNIPRYIEFVPADAAADSDLFLLVQALAPGRSLADRIKDGHRVDEAEARRIAKEILETLVYLHSLSPPVIHRDLKPQNIIVGDDGRVMLVDFGAVRDTLATESEHGSVAGTFGYMAPEQFAGRVLPATDLYGLGATLVHLLARCPPAELPMRGLQLDFRARVHVSNTFAAFLDKLLAPSPDDRFSSAGAALDALSGRLQLIPSRPNPTVAEIVRRPTLPHIGPRARVSRDGDVWTVRTRNVAADGGVMGVAKLGFSVFWLSFVALWTSTAVEADAPGLFVAFSIPFWLVGIGLFISGARSLPSRTDFRLSAEGAEQTVHFLGVPVRRRRWPLRSIQAFTVERAGKVDIHNEHGQVAIASIPGNHEAEDVVFLLEEALVALKR